MLSLLSLLLASGTVLRADTERWTPVNYPNPRKNHTACNTQENSTLCDPDHILTDQWRFEINQNIQKQMQRLTEANVPLSEKAPAECINRTEGVIVYVLLAKRIWTPNNQSITGNDLTKFGDELAKQYGLDNLQCKTFLLLIGIEAAKLAYVRTGKDLKLPTELMQRVFHEYKLFNAKNFMAGLNKIVDEIGRQMSDPFKEQSANTVGLHLQISSAATPTEGTTLAEIVSETLQKGSNRTVEETSGSSNGSNLTAWLMFLSLCTAIILAFGSLALLALSQRRRYEQIAKNNFKQQAIAMASTDLLVNSWRCQCQKVMAENKEKNNHKNEAKAQQSMIAEHNNRLEILNEVEKQVENEKGLDESLNSGEASIDSEDKESINRRVHIGADELLTDAPLSNKHEDV